MATLERSGLSAGSGTEIPPVVLPSFSQLPRYIHCNVKQRNSGDYEGTAFQPKCASQCFLSGCSAAEFQETIECADSSIIVMEGCSVQTVIRKEFIFTLQSSLWKYPSGGFGHLCHRGRAANCPPFDSAENRATGETGGAAQWSCFKLGTQEISRLAFPLDVVDL